MTRSAWRAAVVTVVVPVLPLLGSTAFAVTRDDGDDPGTTLTLGQALAIFVGIPLGLFLLIAVLVYAPSFMRGPRYRPGLGWWAAPVWFAGPPDADAAVASAQPTTEGGGVSARW
jgi:hypothetical protein